jgi:nickel-dependent lactate racemase
MAYRDISIPYGKEILSNFLPAHLGEVKIIDSPRVRSEISDLKTDLINVLEYPVDSPPLKDLVAQHYPGSGKKILLIADDNTRPNIHTRLLFPMIFEYLVDRCGVKEEDLGILIASGTHRPPTGEEIKERILGKEIFSKYSEQILVHNDQENLADLGYSNRETPIKINQDAFDACLLIPVTDSEYHYFAGLAGTVKQLFPGIAGRITINTNHSRMFDREKGFKDVCRLGNTDHNPVITDIKEMATIFKQHTPVFCVDSIMDRGEITAINAGDIISLHELANQLLFKRRVIEVDRGADLVIISMGKIGINLFQAGKGIHAAWNAVKKPGGSILLLAPCQDGAGSAGFQDSMTAVKDLELHEALNWVIDNTCSRETFKIGNQKPVDVLRILKTLGEGQINILSEMDPDELRDIYRLIPIPEKGSSEESLRGFLQSYLEQKPDALIYLLRDSTLYVVPEDQI